MKKARGPSRQLRGEFICYLLNRTEFDLNQILNPDLITSSTSSTNNNDKENMSSSNSNNNNNNNNSNSNSNNSNSVALSLDGHSSTRQVYVDIPVFKIFKSVRRNMILTTQIALQALHSSSSSSSRFFYFHF